MKKKMCIIGCGAGGLCALKKSLDEGHICEAFEQTGTVGGTWIYTETIGTDEYGLPVHSSMYEGLRTNLPKEVMEYDDYSYDETIEESYIAQDQVLRYIENYAEHFNLYQHIKFYKKIVSVDPVENQKWLVKIMDVKSKQCEEKLFDFIMVCVGHYAEPLIPSIDGIETFTGQCIHSHSYRTTGPYKNKKVVLVGGGPSGVDISRLLYPVAQKIILSCRYTKFKDELFNYITQKPLIKNVSGNVVKFEDDTEEIVDDIILCTGYLYSYPFLSKNCKIEVVDNYVKHLYKEIINVEHPTMAFLGIPSAICPFPAYCLQMRFILSTINGHFKLPSKESMLNDIKKEEGERNVENKYLHVKVGSLEQKYFNDLAETANVKKMPRFVFDIHENLRLNGRKWSDRFRIVNDDHFEKF